MVEENNKFAENNKRLEGQVQNVSFSFFVTFLKVINHY